MSHNACDQGTANKININYQMSLRFVMIGQHLRWPRGRLSLARKKTRGEFMTLALARVTSDSSDRFDNEFLSQLLHVQLACSHVLPSTQTLATGWQRRKNLHIQTVNTSIQQIYHCHCFLLLVKCFCMTVFIEIREFPFSSFYQRFKAHYWH